MIVLRVILQFILGLCFAAVALCSVGLMGYSAYLAYCEGVFTTPINCFIIGYVCVRWGHVLAKTFFPSDKLINRAERYLGRD